MGNMTKLASIQQHYYAQGQARAIAEAGLTKEARAGKLDKLLALTAASGAGAGIGMHVNDAIKARMAMLNAAGKAENAASREGIKRLLESQAERARRMDEVSRYYGQRLMDRASDAADYNQVRRTLLEGPLEDRVQAARRMLNVPGQKGVNLAGKFKKELSGFRRDGMLHPQNDAGLNENSIRLLSGNPENMERFLRDQPALSSVPKVLEEKTLMALERAATGPNTRKYVTNDLFGNKFYPEVDKFPLGRGVLSPEAIRELVGF